MINKYYKAAQKYAKTSGKQLSEIKMLQTLIGEYQGFDYDGNLIFCIDDTMVVQEKDETDPNWIHEISTYEIEEL